MQKYNMYSEKHSESKWKLERTCWMVKAYEFSLDDEIHLFSPHNR